MHYERLMRMARQGDRDVRRALTKEATRRGDALGQLLARQLSGTEHLMRHPDSSPLARWPMAFSPDGARLAVGDANANLVLWDLETRTPSALMRGHREVLRDVGWIDDGTLVTVASDDRLMVFEPNGTVARRERLRGHRFGIATLDIARSVPMLATGCRDGVLRIWHLDGRTFRPRKITLSSRPNSSILAVALSADGRRAVVRLTENWERASTWGRYTWSVNAERVLLVDIPSRSVVSEVVLGDGAGDMPVPSWCAVGLLPAGFAWCEPDGARGLVDVGTIMESGVGSDTRALNEERTAFVVEPRTMHFAEGGVSGRVVVQHRGCVVLSSQHPERSAVSRLVWSPCGGRIAASHADGSVAVHTV